ncbi:lipid A biosynthesis lauroyl acyltransferase [Rhizobiaceae bacterium BDR2-2]|uniref:Lipid A biosynthesis lauroyl acyltransferase n=1 Tax=Ectorhizobium quercum TaxID=2965071 RepID=A0AAE3N739_9HYPH|nr:lipid A biosynthesis lauroyl acyltransferase [Ectorhizobium quercum]MCX8999782.1 lipid A biosynthesis lauroyl acyltransferase [Ectorhizobium quercum]
MDFGRFRQWMIAQVALGILRALKILPADAALNFAARLARRIAPKLRRHRLVLTNLRNAFPEKTPEEIETLAAASWEHLGRMAAEYVFFEKLFMTHPVGQAGSRVEIVGQEHLVDLLARPRAFIFATAHTGNFECLPYGATAWGIPVAVLFRPPNNPFIAEHLARLRGAGSEKLVPSYAGSSKVLARQLAAGEGIGVLVDQKFNRGVEARFFGLPATTNPLVPRLVRQFHCDVVPVRSIRTEGNRYRIEVSAPMELPRNAEGEIDVEASCQAINDMVEAWVREYPEQWLWYHDRWNVRKTAR